MVENNSIRAKASSLTLCVVSLAGVISLTTFQIYAYCVIFAPKWMELILRAKMEALKLNWNLESIQRKVFKVNLYNFQYARQLQSAQNQSNQKSAHFAGLHPYK